MRLTYHMRSICDIITHTMKLIVGLGNPGKEYEATRHNCGFRAIDLFADKAGLVIDKDGFKGLYTSFKFDGETIILFKPQTFMNLSGTAVREIVNFYKIDLHDIVVIYDDMALEPGEIRLRVKGSSGGQKGIQNIIDNLGTDEIQRIRIGIGEPEYNAIDYVLGKPNKEDKEKIDSALEKAALAIKEYLTNSFVNAMNKYN